MKIKVSDLQPGKQMDALVAEAQGWNLCKYMNEAYDVWDRGECDDDILVDDYNPSINGWQAMELVKEFNIQPSPAFDGHGGWYATKMYDDGSESDDYYGKTTEIAICRTVIAAHFGESVEIEEE